MDRCSSTLVFCLFVYCSSFKDLVAAASAEETAAAKKASDAAAAEAKKKEEADAKAKLQAAKSSMEVFAPFFCILILIYSSVEHVSFVALFITARSLFF